MVKPTSVVGSDRIGITGSTIVPELDCEFELMVIATGIQAPADCSAPLGEASISQSQKDRFTSS